MSQYGFVCTRINAAGAQIGEVVPMEIKTENEQKKEYLWKYREHVLAIKRLESELAEIKIMKRYPSAKIGDGMPHGTNMSDLSDYAALLDKLERDLQKERYLRIKQFCEVDTQIQLLDSEKEKSVLHYRYIKGLAWWQIAEKMNYTERWVRKIHGQALINFKLPKEFLVIPGDV